MRYTSPIRVVAGDCADGVLTGSDDTNRRFIAEWFKGGRNVEQFVARFGDCRSSYMQTRTVQLTRPSTEGTRP